MYYGKFGLANISKAGRKKYGTRKLEYGTYSLDGRKLSHILKAQWQSLWHMYLSMWKMVSANVIGLPEASVNVNHYDIPRRVEAVYFDNLFPNYFLDTKVWHKYLDRLQDYLDPDWKRLETTSRNASVRLVIALRPKSLFTPQIGEIFHQMWFWLGWPKPKPSMSTVKRFFVFTSSIPGNDVKAKSKSLAKWNPLLGSKICIVADDLSFIDTMRLCKKYSMRGSFDVTKVRDDEGKRIGIKHPYWKYLEATWKDGPGSSVMLPVVFCSDTDDKKINKLLKHYSKKADIVLM